MDGHATIPTPLQYSTGNAVSSLKVGKDYATCDEVEQPVCPHCGSSLTAEQRDRLTQQVNDTWGRFKQAVTRRRTISEADMEGQTFYGLDAREKKLVDACKLSLYTVRNNIIIRHSR